MSQDAIVYQLGSSLDVLGNYSQTAGDFDVREGANFQTSGSFNYTGSNFFVRDGSTFNIGNLFNSSVHTGTATIYGGSHVALGTMSATNDVVIYQPGSSLLLTGNYSQTAGAFDVQEGASFQTSGSFNYTGNSFRVRDGSTFSVGNPSGSSVQTGNVAINGGSQVTLGTLSASDNVDINDAGSLLHVLGNYSQTAGGFNVNTASFQTGGTFNYVGNSFHVVGTSTFSVGNPSGSSVQTGNVAINGGSQVTLGTLSASDNVDINDAGSLLHVLGNYSQTAGGFNVNTASFQTGGTFNYVGNSFHVVGTSTFSVGNPSGSSVQTGNVSINGGSQVTLGTLSASDNVDINDAGSLLHVLGNYSQTAGGFNVNTASFQTGGTFNYVGNSFHVVGTSTFSVGNPSGSSVQTGNVSINGGSQVTLGTLSASDNVDIYQLGASLHLSGNYSQTAGYFHLADASLQTGGAFNYVGNSFQVTGTSTFSVGNPSGSSVQTGNVSINGGSQVTLGTLSASDNVDIYQLGASLHLSGNYSQTAGYFHLADASLQTGGAFNYVGNSFQVTGTSTFSVGNPSGSSVQSGNVSINGGSQVTLGTLTASDFVYVYQPGTFLHVLGNYTQTAGAFHEQDDGHFQADGGFNYTGDDFYVLGSSTLLVGSARLGNYSQLPLSGTVSGSAARWNVLNSLELAGDATGRVTNLELSVTGGAQVIIGGQLKVGSGSRLTGDSTVTASSILVDSGGTLDGQLTTQAAVTNRGTIAPGSGVGAMTIAGSFVQESTGTLEIEVGGLSPGATNDVLNVSGTTAVAGRLDVPLVSGFAPHAGDEISFLTSTGSIVGSFAQISTPDLETAGGGLGIELLPGTNQYRLRFVTPTDTNHFQGTASTSNWSDVSNWSAGSAPSSNSIVAVQNLAGTAQSLNVTQNTFVHSLAVSGGTNPLSLAIQNGSSFSSLTGINIQNMGLLDVDSGRTVTSRLDVGSGGTVLLINGGQLLAQTSSDTAATVSTGQGQTGSSANVLISGVGSEFRTIGGLVVGDAGNGSVAISGQAALWTTNTNIGNAVGAVGSVSVTGANSKWLVDDAVYIGGNATAPGGTGLVTVSDHAELAVGNRLHLWSGGDLTLPDGNASVAIGKGAVANLPGTVQVLPGGILSGKGTVHANTLNRGLVRPGASPGILHIDGNYVQNADGALEIEVGGLTPGVQHDQVVVTGGSASLGGQLTVPFVNGFVPDPNSPTQNEVTFLTATGGINGRFDSVYLPDLARVSNLAAVINYTSNTHSCISLRRTTMLRSLQRVPAPYGPNPAPGRLRPVQTAITASRFPT